MVINMDYWKPYPEEIPDYGTYCYVLVLGPDDLWHDFRARYGSKDWCFIDTVPDHLSNTEKICYWYACPTYPPTPKYSTDKCVFFNEACYCVLPPKGLGCCGLKSQCNLQDKDKPDNQFYPWEYNK